MRASDIAGTTIVSVGDAGGRHVFRQDLQRRFVVVGADADRQDLLLLSLQIGHRPLKHHAAAIDDADMGHQPLDLGQQVARDEDRDAVLAC